MMKNRGQKIEIRSQKLVQLLVFGLMTLGLTACGNFPEKYENVIEDGKIRPFAIVLEPAEAAPGDTVHVKLHIHDAGKNYSLQWQLALNYNIDNYGAFTNNDGALNLDSMRLDTNNTNPLEFDFVVPAGNFNPLLNSSMIPEVILRNEEMTPDERTALEIMGVITTGEDLTRVSLIGALDAMDTIPADMALFVDGLVSLISLKAEISHPNFKLDVTKTLSIRYSNRLAPGALVSNVNANPRLDSIGIIGVHSLGIDEPGDISKFPSDTQYFSVNAYNNTQPLGAVVDTITINSSHSYFLIADTAGAAQVYRSPSGIEHKEQLFFQWLYTNLYSGSSDWENLIEIGGDDNTLPVVPLAVPEDKNMHNFYLRAVVRDWRPEWASLAPAGIGFLEVQGYFKYEN